MEEQTTELEALEHYIEEEDLRKNLLLRIWTQPRRIFRFIIEKHYDKYVIVLLALGGISRGFNRAVERDMGDTHSLSYIIISSILFGGLFGWIAFYMYSGLIWLTSGMFGGKASTKSIVKVMAYAMIPSVAAMVFLIPQITVYGVEMFREDGDIYSSSIIGNILFYGSAIAELVLGVWSLVLFVIGLAELQKYSVWKAALNILLSIIIIVLIALPIWLFSS